MDIFTTQLTRVAPNKVRPGKLKVKGLLKEAGSPVLDEKHDHLDEHEENTVTEQHARQQYHSSNQNENLSNVKNTSDDSEPENKPQDDDDDHPPTHHLDIFV